MRECWCFSLEQYHVYLNPEILVEGACDHAPLKEDENPPLVALGNFKVEVLPPVAQLCSFQGLHMEVGTLDLKREEWRGGTESKGERKKGEGEGQKREGGGKFGERRGGGVDCEVITLTPSSNRDLFSTSVLHLSCTALLLSRIFSLTAFSTAASWSVCREMWPTLPVCVTHALAGSVSPHLLVS